MILHYFHVDAFADAVFGGNPAAVVLTNRQMPDDVMLAIARENNLPETAFVHHQASQLQLRWFTPDNEMDLCGHATLAAAHVIFTELGSQNETVQFFTASGVLTVARTGNGYTMDFPQRPPQPAQLPAEIAESLSIQPRQVWKSRDYMLVYPSQADVERIAIDRALLDRINLDPGGVIITAPGQECDFVSRFFTPQSTLFEDPVTGSAHCTLAPYWAEQLGKTTLTARQLSQRGGRLRCTLSGDRVLMEGCAVTYAQGTLYLNEP